MKQFKRDIFILPIALYVATMLLPRIEIRGYKMIRAYGSVSKQKAKVE